ncbi:alpha/beta hydrolase [Nocardia uniformis]|uniref:Alpha/beta hydrolase n=1 Tax=Nocardia uniformis TaxID=53432 RepID=A0A849CBR5_9NOCA|nr:alpha/beta hydrolase [Nocardia uniformis]NNH75296.1 alpha/beta hydrolase [Nocardia uniformis]
MQHPARPILNLLTYMPQQRRIELTPAHFGVDYTELRLPTEDGETVDAWFVGAKREPVGHILFAHGNAGNIGDRSPILALLAGVGFDVLIFDYRGYGRSTGSPSERGTYLDARAARQALLGRPGVDPNRIVYLGKSLGGAVLLELAMAYPPAAMVLISSFTGLRDAATAVYPFLPKMFIPDAYPSLRRIRRLRSPLLIMHGDQDELLPLRMGEELFAAAPEPKQIVVFPGAGHNDVVVDPEWPATLTAWITATLAAHDEASAGE